MNLWSLLCRWGNQHLIIDVILLCLSAVYSRYHYDQLQETHNPNDLKKLYLKISVAYTSVLILSLPIIIPATLSMMSLETQYVFIH